MHYEVRGGLFNATSVLHCPSNSTGITCSTDRFYTTTVTGGLSTTSVSWYYRSDLVEFQFDVPLAVETDQPDSTIFLRRKSLYGNGYGPLAGLYDQHVWDLAQPPDEKQALLYLMDFIAGPVNNSLSYDPTLSLTLLFDTPAPTASPVSKELIQENAGVNLVVAIVVPIVVVFVIGIIAVVALVPAVRRRIFGFEGAMHKMRARTEERGRVESTHRSSDGPAPEQDKSWRKSTKPSRLTNSRV